MKLGSSFVIIIIYFLYPDAVHAASEYATFESFYKESSTIGWVITGIFALIAGAAVFFTGGTASPIVLSIGTWIGGTMGLSGIAATNAGLALIGGGTIASGGFGIIGGTALISAALTFGTFAAFDYSIEKAISEYSYSNLAEQSKNMLTLPLPVNKSGSDAYEYAIEILENVNKEEPISSNHNQQIIDNAIIKLINESSTENFDLKKHVKNESLLSLLYFVSNDYIKARKHADVAIKYARPSELKMTLPAFIYATSSLYEEEFDFTSITNNYFMRSILDETNNPLIPLLFSIYLDRMLLRFNDDYLDEKAMNQIFIIMKSPSIEDVRQINYAVIMVRYFILLWQEQQKITSLANTSNNTIKKSPKTLLVVNNSLEKYKRLLINSNLVVKELITLDLDDESRTKIIEFHDIFVKYRDDRERLASIVDELRKYQANLKHDRNIKIYTIIFILMVIVLLFMRKTYLIKQINSDG